MHIEAFSEGMKKGQLLDVLENLGFRFLKLGFNNAPEKLWLAILPVKLGI